MYYVVPAKAFHERLRQLKLEETGKPAGAIPLPELTPEEESRLTTAWFAKQFPSAPGQPSAPAPSVPEMKARLIAAIPVEDGALRQLAQTRSERIRDWLTQQGKIEDTRVFVLEPGMSEGGGEAVATELKITAR